MKTRRSSMFAQNKAIVTETPASQSNFTYRPNVQVASNDNIACASCTTSTVLETPENILKTDGSKSDNYLNSHYSNGKTSNYESLELDITPDLNLQKRKGIVSILESEFSFSKSLKTNKFKNSSMLSNYEKGIIKLKTGKKSNLETILPFDLSDNSLNEKSPAPSKPKMRRKTTIGSQIGNLELKPSRPSTSNGSNMSIDDSMSVHSPLLIRGKRRSMMLSSAKDDSTIYENSELDLTSTTSGSEIILRKSLPTIPKINRNSELDLEISKLNLSSSSSNMNYPHVLSICDFSTRSNLNYEQNLLNGKDKLASIGSPNNTEGSPMTNFDKNCAKELNNQNQSIFLTQPSLSPTQPTSCLVLQGVTVMVDVRSGADNRSVPIEEVLSSLGASIAQKFTSKVSHLVFREGSKATYKKAIERGIHIVSSLWVEACRVKDVRVSESLFPISSDYVNSTHLKRPRKMRSMQPRTFEEEELLVANRMKKRLQSVPEASPSETLSSVHTPKDRNNIPDVNSPLYGVEHLLTPNIDANTSTTSQTSSEKDENDREYCTPLAKRMLNRLMSPQRDLRSPIMKNSRRQPLSPLVINNGGFIPPRESSSSSSDPFSPPHPSPKFRRRSTRIQATANCSSIPELSSSMENNCSEASELEIILGDKIKKNECSSSSLPKKLTTENNRPRKSILKDSSCSSQHKSLNVTYKDSSELTSKDLSSTLRNLTSTSSQSSSSGFRMHKLHSVDNDVLSQDLIIPSTPDYSPAKSVNFPYDDLKVHEDISQRKAMKIHSKKDHANLQVFPLPRRVKRPAECMISESAVEKTETAITRKDLKLKTPKGRFSLIPKQGNSLEEFASPKLTRRKSCFSVTSSPKKSLPTICITSVHSSDMSSIHAIIKSLGGFRIESEVHPNTTHIICGSERRTMNVLFAIAAGCWVLDISWLYESVELLKWAPEEPFELFNFCPGAKVTRHLREKNQHLPLFHNIGRIYIQNCSPKIYVMKDLLHKTGAKISSTLRSADLIIGNESLEIESLVQVTEKWVFDSIQHWQVKDFESYLLNSN